MPEFLTPEAWSGTTEFAFLTSSPVMLQWLVQGPHLENLSPTTQAVGWKNDPHLTEAVVPGSLLSTVLPVQVHKEVRPLPSAPRDPGEIHREGR